MKPQKIQERAQILANVFYFLAILTVLSFALTVASKFIPSITLKNTIDQGTPGLILIKWSVTRPATAAMQANYVLAAGMVLAPMLFAIFFRTAGLFQKISSGTPIFDAVIVKQLQKISFWLYIYDLVPTFLLPLLNHLLTGSFHFQLGISYKLLLALGVSLLIEIFNYGASLQYEVDETV